MTFELCAFNLHRDLAGWSQGFSPLQLKIWQFFYALTLTVITPVS